MKIIEVIANEGHFDTLAGIAEQQSVIDFWRGATDEQGRVPVRLLVKAGQVQGVLDAVQAVFSGSVAGEFRVLVLPVEASMPRVPEDETPPEKRGSGVSREALYQQVASNTVLDWNYLVLVVLSTVVATVGMLENNVAVVIGAMVIAPLLGPNLALALGSALGDRLLVVAAVKTALAGAATGAVTAFLIGLAVESVDYSHELLTRTVVGMDSMALALASGAAAALSLSTGVSSVLVGVMVAVALLPPVATLGIMLADGNWDLAGGALLLLAVNVVSVNLAARVVFLTRGVRPRTWVEKDKTHQSALLSILLWVVFLLILIGILLLPV